MVLCISCWLSDSERRIYHCFRNRLFRPTRPLILAIDREDYEISNVPKGVWGYFFVELLHAVTNYIYFWPVADVPAERLGIGIFVVSWTSHPFQRIDYEILTKWQKMWEKKIHKKIFLRGGHHYITKKLLKKKQAEKRNRSFDLFFFASLAFRRHLIKWKESI